MDEQVSLGASAHIERAALATDKPQSPMAEASNRLVTAIEKAEKSFYQLQEKIGPIMTPMPSGDSPSPDRDTVRSDLVSFIDAAADRIFRVADNLSETRNRVEL